MSPKVSVIIPLYNAENFIYNTLLSVQEQSFQDYECIIVNDFSTDNSINIVKGFLKDKRFKLISLRANSGASTARNVGLRLAKGKYVCFLDSDDVFIKESLEYRVSILENNKDELLIGTYCGSESISEHDEVTPLIKEFKGPKYIDFVTSSGGCPFNTNQPMFITNLLKNTGGFDEQIIQQGEDYELWMRILRLGYYFLITPYTLVCYRSRDGSTIRKDTLNHLTISYGWQREVYTSYYNKGHSFLFEHDIGYYKIQLDIANRVFEFIGMALASDENISNLAKVLVKKLPSYNLFLYKHRDAKKLLMRGVNRQVNNSKEASQYLEKVNLLYALFIKKLKPIQKLIKSGCNDMWYYRNTDFKYRSKVVFLPHKDYHVWTISLMRDVLDQANIDYIVVDLSCHYRDERVRSKARELGVKLISYSNWILSKTSTDLIISFNDWDPIVRSILKTAQLSGIKTASIVEGIQDYLDADTGQSRSAYKCTDMVFLPGDFDRKYFKKTNQKLSVIGVPRVKEIYKKFKSSECKFTRKYIKRILINSNFSYGVLEDKRDSWLIEVVESCLKNGFQPVISRHPADKGCLYNEYVSDKSFYDELENCGFYISRFASGILEALAANLNVIYYNPRIEKVDKFLIPNEAYIVCKNKKELDFVLKNKEFENNKIAVENFLINHCGDLLNDQTNVLVDYIMECEVSEFSWLKFKYLHSKLDAKTGCFNNISIIRDNLNATYSKGNVDILDIDLFLNNKNEKEVSLIRANSLFKLGFFSEAKAMYINLQSRSTFYKFLDINISLCEKFNR